MRGKGEMKWWIIGAAVVLAVIVFVVVLAAKNSKKEHIVRVACVGDSITYGYGIEPRAGRDYPSQLQALLGEGYEVRNFGLSGRTVSGGGDKPYFIEKTFHQSQSYNPNIVIMMLGTNDTKVQNWDAAAFRQDYRFLLESYFALSCVKEMYVVIPPALFTDESLPNMPRGSVLEEELIPIIKEVSAARNVGVVDLFTLFKDKPELLSDGCHPTAEGAALIAQTLYETLREHPVKK